jgi:anti-sigma factor RsiW
MTPDFSTHLSEEALDDVLIGLGSNESHAHLAVCPECRAQVATFRGDIALFNSASMAWSQSRRPKQIESASRGRILQAAFLGWAVVAVALLVMAVGIWRHRLESLPHQADSVQLLHPADSADQIAQDNQLLQAVNLAISPVEASPIEEYKIMESLRPYTKAHSKTRKK